MKEFFKSKDFLILALVYTISNILLLLNYDGVYWDDWVTYNQSLATLKIMYEEIQFVYIGTFATLLTRIGNQVFPFRFYIFASGFLNGVFLYLILKSFRIFRRSSIFFLTLIFLVAPLFGGKNAMTPYGLPVFCFYFGFYLLTSYFESPRIWLRILILFLFYSSFSLNSFLVFYLLVGLYILFIAWSRNEQDLLKSIFVVIRYYSDFILLPIVFFLIKSLFLVPYGDYAGYNSVTLDSIINSPPMLLESFKASYTDIFIGAWEISKSIWLVIFIMGLIIAYFQKDFINYVPHSLFFFIFGVFVFALAAFPYTAVGKVPSSVNFNSRHQAVLSLGFAFMTYMGIMSISRFIGLRKKNTQMILWLIILSFVCNNIYLSYRFHKDHYYQVSIQENFKENKLIKENKTFLVVNQLGSSLVYDRPIDYYEWNGHLKKIFNDETRLMVSVDFLDRLDLTLKAQKYKQNSFSEWIQTEPYSVTISKKDPLTKSKILELFYLRLFNKSLFMERCKPLTEVNVQKYVGEDFFAKAREKLK
jgi:hypothetical protein